MVNFNPIDKDYIVRWQSDLENTKERPLHKPSQDQSKFAALGGVLDFAERCIDRPSSNNVYDKGQCITMNNNENNLTTVWSGSNMNLNGLSDNIIHQCLKRILRWVCHVEEGIISDVVYSLINAQDGEFQEQW